ncbi:MAG: hypothetical protein IPM57_10135 [Oligoflexia bacterium]|nr:hypothetical protein [Oligoflexia bacterium]
MIRNSRRDFFRTIISKVKVNKTNVVNEDVLILGHLAVFPVYSTTKINLKGRDLIVESLPEGVRLREVNGNINFKLSLSGSGLLQAHLNEVWPSAAVLSIFTGEIYNI